jgi:hypothetical protein
MKNPSRDGAGMRLAAHTAPSQANTVDTAGTAAICPTGLIFPRSRQGERADTACGAGLQSNNSAWKNHPNDCSRESIDAENRSR